MFKAKAKHSVLGAANVVHGFVLNFNITITITFLYLHFSMDFISESCALNAKIEQQRCYHRSIHQPTLSGILGN